MKHHLGVALAALVCLVALSASTRAQHQERDPLLVDQTVPQLGYGHWGYDDGSTRPRPAVGSGKRATPKRVAIVGAGPGGTSAAYFLSKAFPGIEIDVFESADRIGGRCHSEELVLSAALNLTARVEWGASIFVEENRNLVQAARAFNLSTDGDPEDNSPGPYVASLWDGSRIVFEMDLRGGWRSKLRGLLRYGLAPSLVARLADSQAAKLANVYRADFPSFAAWGDLVGHLRLEYPINVTATKYFHARSVSPAFKAEVIEAITRVNYGRNLDEVHGLGALIGFVQGPTYTVAEGNQRIFEGFLAASGARVHLNTRIAAVDRDDETGGYTLRTTDSDNGSSYDTVILAIPPTAAASIQLPASAKPIAASPPVTYHHIHVTHVLGRLNATTFPSAPAQILTTKQSRNVQSVSRVRDLSGGLFPRGVHLYKVFSTVSLGNSPLRDTLFDRVDREWAREWDAYPVLRPRKLKAPLADFFPPLGLDDAGLFYLNGFERFLSTMETATVASRNLVRYLQDGSAA
ncbi:hypothetical protein H9P43_005300 [Blastocladiella emersonii ATCC 22665]|nr:hypothetical protein H9P43_005279 [Blastocladiella emersonii ATCC 22665]KAI9179968.1 hypothetical protein H9P43_005300 [Blastocladiella emersonii ATCC 22665]